MTESYWVIPDTATIKTPYTMVLEQANALKDATGGKLVGKVDRGQDGENLTISLDIVVPSLNNYTYRVLYVSHKMTLYPADLYASPLALVFSARDEQSFRGYLQRILSSDEVRRVLAGLLAQVQGEQ